MTISLSLMVCLMYNVSIVNSCMCFSAVSPAGKAPFMHSIIVYGTHVQHRSLKPSLHGLVGHSNILSSISFLFYLLNQWFFKEFTQQKNYKVFKSTDFWVYPLCYLLSPFLYKVSDKNNLREKSLFGLSLRVLSNQGWRGSRCVSWSHWVPGLQQTEWWCSTHLSLFV